MVKLYCFFFCQTQVRVPARPRHAAGGARLRVLPRGPAGGLLLAGGGGAGHRRAIRNKVGGGGKEIFFREREKCVFFVYAVFGKGDKHPRCEQMLELYR